MGKAGQHDETVLVLAPLGRDAELACSVLSGAGLQCRPCRDIDDLDTRSVEGCGAILLTEEVLTERAAHALSARLAAQPAWSNLPVVAFLGRVNRHPKPAKQGLAETLGGGRGVILLERPTRVGSFVSIMQSAVLARRRQYELRDELAARQQAEAHALMLTEEMRHRIKNSLTMVGAVAAQTFRVARPVEDSLDAFSARLKSMAFAQDVLTQGECGSADLHQLVNHALEPYRDGDRPDRIAVDGPAVRIAGRRAMPLTMALHELATNAVKYGALSGGSGRLAVRWRIEGSPGTGRLHIKWRERGGPLVAPPKRRGFGSRLIERGLARELGGHAAICFEPGGVVCDICASLEDIDG